MNDNTITTETKVIEYRVYQGNLPRLQNEIAKLNKRAAKLGVAPVVITLTGRFEDEPIFPENEFKTVTPQVPIGYKRFEFITVTGQTPKLSGWELAAVVEHTAEGNLLRKSPDCKVELAKYRTGAPYCDHCKTIRNRRDTYICLHEDGTVKSVGSNCIRDFLGGKDPAQLARIAEWGYSIGEICEGSEDENFFGCGGRNLLSVAVFLNYAACAIRHCGFITSKKSRESQETGGNVTSTAMTANFWMNPGPKMILGKDYFKPEACDEERAEVSRQHVLDTLGAKAPETLSDFENNLLVACRCEGVEPRNSGLLAFVPEYFARSIEKAKVAAETAFFGEEKKRCRNVKLTYIKSTGWESQFGTTFLHTFAGPDNSRIMWKTGTQVDYTPGAEITATFTVKKHETYNGAKQTKVSRLVIENNSEKVLTPAATPVN